MTDFKCRFSRFVQIENIGQPMTFNKLFRIGNWGGVIFGLLAVASLGAAANFPEYAVTKALICIWFVVPPLYLMWEHWALDRDAATEDRAYLARAEDLAGRLWLGISALLYFVIKR